jgi:hypothetical protein
MSYSTLHSQHSFPYLRNFSFIYSQSLKIELPSFDLVRQLDPADCDCCIPEPLEPMHDIYLLLHSSMVLLYQVVEVLARSHTNVNWQDC